MSRQPYRILMIHVNYLQRGGEDRVVEEETALLRQNHQVTEFISSNRELVSLPSWKQALRTIWNRSACSALLEVLERDQPHIIHVHNTFPLFSPAIFLTLGRWKKRQYKKRRHKSIVLYTLHNFRLLCPQASLIRDGKLCQLCVDRRSFRPALRYACFRSNKKMTWAVTQTLRLHHFLKSWSKGVDGFLYLNQTQKDLFVKSGFLSQKMFYKPNHIPDLYADNKDLLLQLCDKPLNTECRFLFVGRLTEEKGFLLLIQAWKQLLQEQGLSRDLSLTVIGSYENEKVISQMEQLGIEWLGPQPSDQVYRKIEKAHFLLFPSISYEGMPIILLEALRAGLPAISFALGSSKEIIINQGNGLLLPFFQENSEPRESVELSRTLAGGIKEASGINEDRYHRMCLNARLLYENQFTSRHNLSLLEKLYRQILETRYPENPKSRGKKQIPAANPS